ncbi:GH22869 [Drosophila grimshawi]|uniref:trypsin n=2 Tax=Drosophila grimshawi TaxID=7222 RepID=B4JVV2_DROGR|nr:GH22869 [Drosophila grimshawi]
MRILGKSLTLLPPLMLLLLAALVWHTEAHPEGRIINGAQVDITRHSYCVSVRYRRSSSSPYMHECAGVIYSDRGIVTAAQCLVDLTQDTKLIVVAGANTRNGSDGFVYPASRWVHHPQYTPITVDYDIGVIILDTSLDLTQHGLRKIELRPERPATGREAIVIGWGYREEWGPSSPKLEQARVPIVSSEQCNGIYGAGEVTERMICAGDVAQGGTDACQGDTGGPLTVDEQLVGLVSWGRGCGRPGYPSVYTYAPSLKTWIEDTLKSAGVL